MNLVIMGAWALYVRNGILMFVKRLHLVTDTNGGLGSLIWLGRWL